VIPQDKTEEAPASTIADPLEDARKQAAENRDRWIRAVADLENYRKRALAEKSQLLKYRNEELLRDLLSILDNLERAIKHACDGERCDPLTEGVSMTAAMFKEVLSKYGLKEIDSEGQQFDPHFHEAVARAPADNKPNNTVVHEVEKGYMYQDRLLRPSKVVVAVEEQQ
jgi:molecular chaperone GrpE